MNDTRPSIGPIIVEGSVVQPESAAPVGSALPVSAGGTPLSADPEFDAYLAVVKALLGGAVELSLIHI